MSKLTIAPVQAGYRSAEALTQNFEAIEAALENTLSRDGTSPNQMEAELDMNSNRIINLPAPLSPTEPVRLADLEGVSGLVLDEALSGDADYTDTETAPLKVQDESKTDGVYIGFDPETDFGFVQGSKPVWINPDNQPTGVGSYSASVVLTASISAGSDIVTVDVSSTKPEVVLGASVVGVGIPDGATVIEPISWSPSYVVGSGGGGFTTKTFRISANATATNSSASLTVTNVINLDDPIWVLTNEPIFNGDGAFDVQVKWHEVKPDLTARGFIRAHGADFSSHNDFSRGGTENGFVAADGYTSRTVMVNGYPVRFAAFFPYGINMPMDIHQVLTTNTTHSGAYLLENVWNNVVTVPVQKASARIVAHYGGPAFGDDNKLFQDAHTNELAYFTGERPGGNTVNDLTPHVGARIFPWSVAHQLGQGMYPVYDTAYRQYRSRLIGISYGEWHNHMLRPGDDSLTANNTTAATATLIDLDFNRFTTVVSGGAAKLIPAIPNAGPITVVNDGANPLLVFPFVSTFTADTESGEPYLSDLGAISNKVLILRGQALSGTGIPGSTTTSTDPLELIQDINGYPVIKMSANASSTQNGTTVTIGGTDTINGSTGAYTIPPKHTAVFKVFHQTPGAWRATAHAHKIVQASAKANRSGDQTGIAGSATIIFNSEVFDTQGIYNNSTGLFTPPAGISRITATARIKSGHTPSALAVLEVRKNGSFFSYGQLLNVSNGESVSIDTLVSANGTDTFDVFFTGDGNPIVIDAIGTTAQCNWVSSE